MDHYLDIRLLTDPEFAPSILMNALFAKLHRVLAQQQSTGIGISFPSADKRSLGGDLRLHGSAAELVQLMKQPWLKGMHDHIEHSEVAPVPAQTRFCRVQRVQAKSSAERLRRRHLTRHPETPEATLTELIPCTVEKRLKLPYVRLKSNSTGQDYLLFIRQTLVPDRKDDVFNAYGLSPSATVPWF